VTIISSSTVRRIRFRVADELAGWFHRRGRSVPNAKLDFGQFSLLGNGALQVFLMPAGVFAWSRALPGPTKNSVYPYILGHFAHPPLRKLAKVKLRALEDKTVTCDPMAIVLVMAAAYRFSRLSTRLTRQHRHRCSEFSGPWPPQCYSDGRGPGSHPPSCY
jgi:hypothetical protein